MTRHGRWCVGVALAGLTAGCEAPPAAAAPSESDVPVRGGTLEIVSFGDVDHLAPTSAYLAYSMWLTQLISRQLFAYPPSPDNAVKLRPAPDLAVVLPTRANGGISADGLTYTVHMRRNVQWDTPVPRPVVAGDVVRAFKLLCNPVTPAPPLALFVNGVAGLSPFCAQFSRVAPTIAAIRTFVNTTALEGVRAPNDSTVVFRLVAPMPEFLNLLAMPTVAPIPAEYLDDLPDSPASRQHTISNGPYRLAHYIQNREMRFERNPRWDASTDPIRPAHVDRVHVRIGVDAQLQQLQVEAGTADIGAESVRGADVAPLLASKNPTLWLSPTGDLWGTFAFLVINRVGPDAVMLRNRDVRRALSLATDKAALVQVNAGEQAARPLRQAVGSAYVGFVAGADRDVTPGDRGDPDAARRLLARAGFRQSRPMRLAYSIAGSNAMMAQVLQASYERVGVQVDLVPLSSGEFSGRLLGDAANARRGEWDLALISWYPDWFGDNNGRSSATLFDGRNLSSASSNYGGFDDAIVNAGIDRASTATTAALAATQWQAVARRLMDEVAVLPLVETKTPYAHSRRVRNCSWSAVALQCDLTALWLSDALRGRE